MKLVGELAAGGLSVSVYGGDTSKVVYLISFSMGEKSLEEQLPDMPCSVVAIKVPRWNDDLTPWPAPRVFPKAEDFKGESAPFLKTILQQVVPAAEELLGAENPVRYIAGGSLGGLFSVWALYESCIFDGAASISGSMWYDGFCDFAAEREPQKPAQKLWFSLGDEEKISNNKRFASVEDCTFKVKAVFESRGTRCIFHSEPGDHFADPLGRLERALSWLIG